MGCGGKGIAARRNPPHEPSHPWTRRHPLRGRCVFRGEDMGAEEEAMIGFTIMSATAPAKQSDGIDWEIHPIIVDPNMPIVSIYCNTCPPRQVATAIRIPSDNVVHLARGLYGWTGQCAACGRFHKIELKEETPDEELTRLRELERAIIKEFPVEDFAAEEYRDGELRTIEKDKHALLDKGALELYRTLVGAWRKISHYA